MNPVDKITYKLVILGKRITNTKLKKDDYVKYFYQHFLGNIKNYVNSKMEMCMDIS